MNKKSASISLFTSILLVINMIIGSGVFVNTGNLIRHLGTYSPLLYLTAAIILLPVVAICYRLSLLLPGKNLFEIFSNIAIQWLGIFFVVAYVLAKFASVTVSLLFSSRIIALLVHREQSMIFIMLLFGIAFLNLRRFRITPSLQIGICITKLIALVTIVCFGIRYFLSPSYCSPSAEGILGISGGFSCISYALFAFSGFESIFSFMGNLKKGEEKKSFLGIVVGFIVALVMYTVYQWVIAHIVFSHEVMQNARYEQVIALFVQKVSFPTVLIPLIFLFLIISSFGVSYGTFYANANNLLVLYRQKYGEETAKVCYGVIGSICFIVILFSLLFYQNILPLQQVVATGTLLTYAAFIISLLKINRKLTLLSCLGILSVVLLSIFFIKSIESFSYLVFVLYFLGISAGMKLFY